MQKFICKLSKCFANCKLRTANSKPAITEDHMMYGFWDMECNWQNFLSFRAIFCRFTPLITPKIEILKKWKKPSGDTIILHMCTIHDNHMMYGSWDMKCDRQNFLLFWTVFCLFTPLTTRKIKILQNWKNTWRCHHFTQVYQKSWSYARL